MTRNIQDCIWCKRPVWRENEEHILPDSLGCSPEFVLTCCVCISCNNGLGHVDQALLHDFEIIAFNLGVQRKGARPPVIAGWRGIRAEYGPYGPEIHLNAGPQTVESFGRNLHAASAHSGISGIVTENVGIGQRGEIKFKQAFGTDPKFHRAVYKVAFGALAYFLGAAEALHDVYNPVREFVRKGTGSFDVLMMGGITNCNHAFYPPVIVSDCELPLVEMAIFGVSFAVDLDPNQRGLAWMRRQLTEREVRDWMVLPRAA